MILLYHDRRLYHDPAVHLVRVEKSLETNRTGWPTMANMDVGRKNGLQRDTPLCSTLLLTPQNISTQACCWPGVPIAASATRSPCHVASLLQVQARDC
jgi:hypothetical protein